MKFSIIFTLILALGVSACSYKSNWESHQTDGGDPTPEAANVGPKNVAEVINAMQFRTEGSCAMRNLALHYLATNFVNSRNGGTEQLRIALYGDHNATVSRINIFAPGLTGTTNMETTWQVKGDKVEIARIGTIHISVTKEKVAASLLIEEDGVNFGYRGENLVLNKYVDFPEAKFNNMDCLPSLRLQKSKLGVVHSNWEIAKGASPILNRPTLNDVIPEAYHFLIYKFEGHCSDGSRRLHFWQADYGSSKVRMSFYNDGAARINFADDRSLPIRALWAIVDGKVVVGFFNDEGPLVPERVFATINIEDGSVVAEFGDHMAEFSRKRVSLQSRFENVTNLDGNGCSEKP